MGQGIHVSLLLLAARLSRFALAVTCSALPAPAEVSYRHCVTGLKTSSGLKKEVMLCCREAKWEVEQLTPKEDVQIPVLSRVCLIVLHHAGRGSPF